jgi:hypothetical protein
MLTQIGPDSPKRKEVTEVAALLTSVLDAVQYYPGYSGFGLKLKLFGEIYLPVARVIRTTSCRTSTVKPSGVIT